MKRKIGPRRWFGRVAMALLCSTGAVSGQNAAAVHVRVVPAEPLLEAVSGGLALNIDFALTNISGHTERLSRMDELRFDARGRLVAHRSINSNGLAPAIATVGEQKLPSGQTIDVFNPFYALPGTVAPHRIAFRFYFVAEDTAIEAEANRHRLPDDTDAETEVLVTPVLYRSKTRLVLPMHGSLFIWDGHDYYSHHRRVPLSDERVKAMGIGANSNRYAQDFVVVDDGGSMHRAQPQKRKDWYCYGAAVYAPGGGRVIEAVNDVPENEFVDGKIAYPDLPEGMDPKGLGNHVVIDHGDGEYSLLLHMKRGSVVVRKGQRVGAGERLGEVGFSGDAIFPHLHYALMRGPEAMEAEGIPAYFHDYIAVRGSRRQDVGVGPMESGEFLSDKR